MNEKLNPSIRTKRIHHSSFIISRLSGSRKAGHHFLYVLILFLTTSPVLGAVLKADVPKVYITPPVGLRMWVYENRKGPATGVLDPLYARVLVLEGGEKRWALVALDLGRPFGPASIAHLREAAEKSSHIDY